jgi:hypothetical protein
MQTPKRLERGGSMPQIEPNDIPDRLPLISYNDHPLYTVAGQQIRLRDKLFALVRVAEFATYVLAAHFWQLLRGASRFPALDSDISQALARDGLFIDRLSSTHRGRVLEASQSYFERLALIRDKIPLGCREYADNQLNLENGDAPDLFRVLERVLSDCGVLAGMRQHLGGHGQLRIVTIQINDEWDTYWRGHFEERGLEPPPTAFFHIDNTYGVAKVIIYVSTVDEDNGPFSYVPGSHRIKTGRFESLVLRATDIWLDVHPRERYLFMALPRRLHRKAKFGDDLEKDSEWARWLLSRERVVTSVDGDILAFDVGGVHRGGMVNRGERRIIQIMIR